MIQYLSHREIDKVKWNTCIDASVNGLVYAKSWFLDIVSPAWEGLVEDDYAEVMPLPVKQKFFIPYIVQPLFTQQLGVFSSAKLSSDRILEYINNIPRKFVKQTFCLNSSNVVYEAAGFTNRYNFELGLNSSYEAIYDKFNENTRRNIRKAQNAGVVLEFSTNVPIFVDMYRKSARLPLAAQGERVLRALINYAVRNHLGTIVFVRDQTGMVISGAFFMKDLRRIIYVGSFTTPKGEMVSAMFLVMNEMIKRNAQAPCTFDFEGSMIPGVARFFAGFGAERSVYQMYRRTLFM